MHTDLLRPITNEEVETYQTDGVVFLPGMFLEGWIELLAAGLGAHMNEPTHRARVWDRDREGRTTFWDSQAWMRIDQYRRFVMESPAAQIAARLMKSESVNFFFDAVFVRSSGAQFQTPWHQDEPYWSVDGFDTCTLWMPLVPVSKQSALGLVPGSHRGNKVYRQVNFGMFNADGKDDVDQSDFSSVADTPMPDISADPRGFGVRSWDMEPGDTVVFNGRLIHGGSGMLEAGRNLSVFTSKWLGDDVRIIDRESGMDPDHTEMQRRHGLNPGDRPGTDLYPQVWPRRSA